MGWCSKHILFHRFNELIGRNQNENIQVEGKSGVTTERLFMAELTNIMSNPSKDTVCIRKSGEPKSQVHC